MPQIIIQRVGQKPVVEKVPDLELETMQSIVGGPIECIAFPHQVDLWCNEEGKLMGLKKNIYLPHLEDTIVGDVFFTGRGDENGPSGLTDDQIADVLALFEAEED